MKIIKGLIKKQISNQYTVVNLIDNEEYIAIPSGRLRHVRVGRDSSFNQPYGRSTKARDRVIQISPKVGDHVTVQVTENDAVITEIMERKNDLVRPDVANIDQVLLVFSATKPEFSFNLLDKFLVILNKQNLYPVLVVSKIDLVKEKELEYLEEKLRYYKQYLKMEIHYINSKQKVGFDILENIFKNKITVLAGQTGVGKSTLLNALIPELKLKTQEISEALGRGKHTTRHSELYLFNEGYICDTPGFSRVDLEIYESDELKFYYEDFTSFSEECKFSSCNHVNEPGCAIKKLVEKGVIPVERYENYLIFYNEVLSHKNKF